MTASYLHTRIQEARGALMNTQSNMTQTTRQAIEDTLLAAERRVSLLYRDPDARKPPIEDDARLGDLYGMLGRAKSDRGAWDIWQELRLHEAQAFQGQIERRVLQGTDRSLLMEEVRAADEVTPVMQLFDRAFQNEQALEEAQEQTAQAVETAKAAAAAAGKKADVELSGYFEKVATSQARTAAGWTAAAILTTLAGAASGYLLHQYGGLTQTAALIYPAIVAVSLIGLGAYFARLGGHHRHTATWAKGIAVQLDSYERFVFHTSEEARVAVFDKFAARVLGAPPPRSARSAGNTDNVALAEIVALLSKQAT